MVSDDRRRYLAQREQAEHDAARLATCPEARRVHEELAQLYAAAGRSAAAPAPDDNASNQQAIITTRLE